MMTIPVPDLTHPTLCWAQAPTMVRCNLPKGHPGPHSWEHARATPRTIQAVVALNPVIVVPQPSQVVH